MSRREWGDEEKKSDRIEEEKQGGVSDMRSSGTLLRTSRLGTMLKVEDEPKRYTRWLSFARPRVVLGFDRLPKASAPNMKENPRGIALNFTRIQGWGLPAQMLHDIDSGDFYISVQLSLSLCHLATKTFFGSTWLGVGVSLGQGESESIPDVVDFDYSDIIYAISRLTDPSCVGIVEVVVSKVSKSKNVTISQHGCGWTMIPLFAEPLPADISDGYEEVPEMTSSLFHGSPRDLITKPYSELDTKLKEIKGSTINYKLFSHRKLLRAQMLLAENELIGRFDLVAGLIPKTVTLIGDPRPQTIPCIGDSQLPVDERSKKNRQIVVIPATPKVSKVFSLRISDLQLILPKRIEIESKIRVNVARNLTGKDASECQIVSRFLKVGIHNGHCLVGGDWKVCKLMEDSDDNEVLLAEQENIDVFNYIPHTHIALVFLIEYQVGIPYSKEVSLDIQKTLETTVRDGRLITSVSVGATAFLPYTSSGTLVLRNVAKAEGDDKTLDMELSVQSEELCAVLSPNPVFRWNSTTIRDDKKDRNGPSDDQPIMGFDLRAYNPSRKLVEHGYEVTEKDRESVKDSTYPEDSIPIADSDKKNNLNDEHKGSESDDQSDNYSNLSRERKRNRFSQSKTPRDSALDEIESLPESIVGNDLGVPALRLEKEFYTSSDKMYSEARVDGDLRFLRERDFRQEPLIPKDKNSLLGRSLMAKLLSGGVAESNRGPSSNSVLQQSAQVSRRDAPRGLPVEDDGPAPQRAGDLQRAQITRSGGSWPVFSSDPGKNSHVRELTRASRARLGRHGFLSAQAGSAVSTNQRVPHPSQANIKQFIAGKNVVDVELEASDSLALNEISIQFAGYRHNHPTYDSESNNTPKWQYSPKAVYFTFQFFTCAPVRTEAHRLLPADRGEMNVLCRDDPHSRDEQPLTVRFEIDCSTSDPFEAIEFAEYLARGTLQIDVWDADSLLLLGSTRFPLSNLLRQGKQNSFSALECDVIDIDCGNTNAPGGVTTFTVADYGGAPSGAIVGAVNIIAENAGRAGRHPTSSFARYKQSRNENGRNGNSIEDNAENEFRRRDLNPVDGLNWRALGITSANKSGSRPRHIVRARPLSESTPELSKALSDQQRSANLGLGPSMRSLSSIRGNNSVHTLTYDDIMVLFKLFQGKGKGSVQYEGKLLTLLDVPSWSMSIRKLMDAFSKSINNGDNVELLLGTYADAFGNVSLADLKEFFKAFMNRYGVAWKQDELSVLAKKFISDERSQAKVVDILAFCNTEHERLQWSIVGKRFRNAAQKAALSGEDVEQTLSEKDSEGYGYITTRDFKSFLEELSVYGRLTLLDINSVCKFFARRPSPDDRQHDPISLKEVMAFLGKPYIGNLTLRLRDSIMYIAAKAQSSDSERVPRSIADVVKVFRRHADTSSGSSDKSRAAVISDIESALTELGVFEHLLHEQVSSIINKCQSKCALNNNKFTFGAFLRFIGIEYKGDLNESKSDDNSEPSLSNKGEALTPEYLLRELLEYAKKYGVALDSAFRHFDADGNGTISTEEFVKAFEELKIFSNIPNWKDQIPLLVAKFDNSGDTTVSLREFFEYLGVKDYTANILQRMTKIFGVAISEEGMSFDTIFGELDKDGDGKMTVAELFDCLKGLGQFNDISEADVQSCFSQFDTSGKGEISSDEFKSFFIKRVEQANAERQDRLSRKNIKNFIELMGVVISKGTSPEQLFQHFDQDKGGTIATDELRSGLTKLPAFKSLTKSDVESLVAALDKNKSGSISQDEFVSFLKLHVKTKPVAPAPLDQSKGGESSADGAVKKFSQLMDAAVAQGVTAEKLFEHIDNDNSKNVTIAELSASLIKLPLFKSLSNSDMKLIMDDLDFNRNGTVSLDEFKSYLARPRKSQVAGGAEPILEKFRQLMHISTSKGLAPEKIFNHFDSDRSGALSVSELTERLSRLNNFKSLTNSDKEVLIKALDTDRNGTISLTEFMNFCSETTASRNAAGDAYIQKIQRIFKIAVSKGTTIEKLFQHFDSNKDGELNVRELEDSLLDNKAFDELSSEDIARLIKTVDSDGSGSISIAEFKSFVINGIPPTNRKSKVQASVSERTREMLLRHLRRISEPDGTIAGLLAYLDRDEDGEISLLSFLKLLRREGVLDSMKQEDITDWLKPVMTSRSSSRLKDNISRESKSNFGDIHGSESKSSYKGDSESKDEPESHMIKIVPLMHLLDGEAAGTSEKDEESKFNEQLALQTAPEYGFSTDPVTRELEKKLRGVGHALARKGLDVEGLFKSFDTMGTGIVRRTEFLEILSEMGLYIIEQGKALDAAQNEMGDQHKIERQMMKVRGIGASQEQAVRTARKFVMSSGDVQRGGSAVEFQDHLESMALINWYRQSQKKMLIQRVLSHSLASTERLYPRFGKTLFFEYPISNPFAHEERFIIDCKDPELRLVTNFDEWIQLRASCRPCVGELGPESLETEMFDKDGHGNVQVSLLPQETLWIPFTFMTLSPYVRTDPVSKSRSNRRKDSESKRNDADKNEETSNDIEATRSVMVRILSGTHGHVVANLQVDVCHKPFIVNRVFRFFEPDNTVMKRRIKLIGNESMSLFPGQPVMSSKYVHCVENGPQNDCRVVVEWGPSGSGSDHYDSRSIVGANNGESALDILMRYRCSNFPSSGDFYVLLYNDPYQSHLHELWHVIVQTRQRLDVNTGVGSSAAVDLVVRGDRYNRRAKAFSSNSVDRTSFEPNGTFQMVPMSFNRLVMKYSPSSVGSKRIQLNLVDSDSRELISAWILMSSVSAPEILRQYDIDGLIDVSQHKKIVFQNPWDVPRRFTLVSSNEAIMRPRSEILEVGPQASVYLRIWIAGVSQNFSGVKEVFLFLNDESGQSEDSFSFRIHSPSSR